MKSTDMQLHYQYQPQQNSSQTLVFLHGLFGSLSNLGMLARALQDNYSILQLDLRNHGLSGHSDQHNYDLMAQDVIDTLDYLEIKNFHVIGHSMGGKVAMRLAQLAPQRLDKLVILDISPFASHDYHHTEIFKALFAVEDSHAATRQEATKIMQKFIPEPMVIQFLLKSFNQGKWLFNVSTLFNQYSNILNWQDQTAWQKSALFLRGENSDYISKPEHFDAIKHQFPNAQIYVVKNAGHWLHGEKPNEVLESISNYLNN